MDQQQTPIWPTQTREAPPSQHAREGRARGDAAQPQWQGPFKWQEGQALLQLWRDRPLGTRVPPSPARWRPGARPRACLQRPCHSEARPVDAEAQRATRRPLKAASQPLRLRAACRPEDARREAEGPESTRSWRHSSARQWCYRSLCDLRDPPQRHLPCVQGRHGGRRRRHARRCQGQLGASAGCPAGPRLDPRASERRTACPPARRLRRVLEGPRLRHPTASPQQVPRPRSLHSMDRRS